MDSPKKILYIQKPPGGGSLIALYEMVKVLDRTKYEPIILCYEQNKYTQVLENLEAKVIYFTKAINNVQKEKTLVQKKKKGFKVAYQLKRFFIDDFKTAKRIKQVIAENKIDLVHHNCDFPFIRQGLLAKSNNIPQICHYRSLQPYKKYSIEWMIDKWLVRKIDYHICISNAVQNHFHSYLNIPLEKTLVLRDIIDVSKFKESVPDIDLKRSLGLLEEDIVITSIGRILPWKGQHIFIQAFSQLIKTKPNAKALVVGPYDDGLGNVDYFKSLQQMAIDFGLQDKIIFTGNRDDIPALIAISDCIVHSSISPEPQGLVIVEALFCNKPVVVSDSGGSAELIVNDEGGLKCISGNAMSMASAISKVLEKNDTHVSTNKAPSILQDFIPKKQIAKVQDIYDHLLLN